MTDDSATGRLAALRKELAQREAELADMRAAMPRHSVRVHQQLALEDAEDEVRRLRAEVSAAEAESPAADR